MTIRDTIRPNPEKFLKETDKTLGEIKKLMARIATEINEEKISELSEEIQKKANYIRALAIIQEKKEGREKIEIFMTMLTQNTPQSQGTKKIALYNAKNLLDNILSNIMFDVSCMKKFIDSLERELRTANIEKEYSTEIMNEVYAQLRKLSKVNLNSVLTSERTDFFRANLALGYLSLIPNVNEKEIRDIGQKLLTLSPHYADTVEKYIIQTQGPRFIAKKDELFIGKYNEEICLIKVLRNKIDTIVCRASFINSEALNVEFDITTGKSLDKQGILWEKLDAMQCMDPKVTLPEPHKLPEYSINVLVLHRSKTGEEKIGIGYYHFSGKNWLIILKNTANAIGIESHQVISWFKIPEKYVK